MQTWTFSSSSVPGLVRFFRDTSVGFLSDGRADRSSDFLLASFNLWRTQQRTRTRTIGDQAEYLNISLSRMLLHVGFAALEDQIT
jgi:hypothetical protein